MSASHDLKDFVAESTEWIASRIAAKQADGRSVFRLCLCGGFTPRETYGALALRPDIDWERVLLTFGDERCVPPDDSRSNYRMAREALLGPGGVPPASVMRMTGEMDPAEAAERYEGQLRLLARLAGETIFHHDLVLLGMGEDGHVASLFPGSPALEETERWVAAQHVPALDGWRLTMTYPLINAAGEAAFLVTGDKKRPLVEKILAGESDCPAARVKAGEVTWLLG